jgi:predicted  nucleic acid-binding Zn-ribbon protein
MTDNIWDSRTAAVTADVLKEYQEMISNTTSDLEDHLQEIERKLQALPLRGDAISDEDAAERERIQEERDSTRQCLAICEQVYKQVNLLRPNIFEDVSAARGSYQLDISALGGLLSAKRLTASALQQLQEKLTNTTSQLEEHLQNIDKRLATFSSPGARDRGEIERRQVQEEMDSAKQCLAICVDAYKEAHQSRTNVIEDVSAAKASHQVVVATLGDLISAKRVNAAPEARQWVGQMADATVQQLSRDNGIQLLDQAALDQDVEPQRELGLRFAGQYGAGYKLS